MPILKPSEEGLLDIKEANKDPNEKKTPIWVTFFKAIWYLIKLSPLLAVFSAAGYLYYYRTIVVEEQVASRTKEIKSIAKKFNKDVGINYKYPIFKKPGLEKNAGLFLNERIPWLNTVDMTSLENTSALQIEQLETGEYSDKTEKKRFGLDNKEENSDAIERPATSSFDSLPMITLQVGISEAVNGAFPNQPSPPLAFDALDLEWFAELKNFDHWDIESGKQTQYAVLGGVYPDKFPTPDYDFLRTLARIELLRGKSKKELIPALERVHNLASLISTQEVPDSHLASHKILNDIFTILEEIEDKDKKEEIINYFKSKGIILNRIVILSNQKLPAGYQFLFNLFTIQKVEKYLSNSDNFAGKCLALRSTMIEITKFMPLFFQTYEAELNSLTRILDAHKKVCRLNYVRSIWAHMMAQPNSRTSKAILSQQNDYIGYSSAIPFSEVRKFIGQVVYIQYLDNIQNPYSSSSYSEKPKSTETSKDKKDSESDADDENGEGAESAESKNDLDAKSVKSGEKKVGNEGNNTEKVKEEN